MTWTSCDNVYLPSSLERMASVLQKKEDVEFVYASMQIIDENGQLQEIVKSGPPEDLIFRNVVGACFFYKRSIWEKVGFYDPAAFLCEDYDY